MMRRVGAGSAGSARGRETDEEEGAQDAKGGILLVDDMTPEEHCGNDVGR
jgi:hypothetical protein